VKGSYLGHWVSSQLFNIVACARRSVKIVAPLRGVMPRLFAAKLQYVRVQQGLAVRDLAEKVGFASYQYIWLLERDQRTPSLDMVVRIAAYFNISTDYFLRDTIAVDAPQITSTTVLANEEELPRLFGGRLRMLRLQQGWSQTDLAQKLNLKRRGYISNLESGRKMPSLDLIVQIADLFGVTTDHLLNAQEVTVDTVRQVE
jgi:transcriptional regulator with XRE-family HTH domain